MFRSGRSAGSISMVAATDTSGARVNGLVDLSVLQERGCLLEKRMPPVPSPGSGQSVQIFPHLQQGIPVSSGAPIPDIAQAVRDSRFGTIVEFRH